MSMALQTLSALDRFKASRESPFPPGYPDNIRTFYSPVDNLHGALEKLLESAEWSIIVAMYGYDDPELNEIIREKLTSDDLFVQMTLDRSQASKASDKKILEKWLNDDMGNSIAIGTSEFGAIMHMKVVIIDGVDVVTGSTNWSEGGQTKQDNQLIVIRDPLVAAEARARLDIIHDAILKEMAGRPPKRRRPRLAPQSQRTPRSRRTSASSPKPGG